MQEYKDLLEAYYAKYPGEREEKTIEALLFSYGLTGAIEIMKEAKGRFIVITYGDKGNDIVNHSFEER